MTDVIAEGQELGRTMRAAWETHNICRCGECYACERGLAVCLWCRGGELDLFKPCAFSESGPNIPEGTE
jgi:hypothetical protein